VFRWWTIGGGWFDENQPYCWIKLGPLSACFYFIGRTESFEIHWMNHMVWCDSHFGTRTA
jgi:hypothetical protein